MERTGMPVAIGGAVAILALVLSPLGSRGPSKEASQGATKLPELSEPQARRGASATAEALARDDRGPWYALCQEVAGDEAAPAEQLEELERTVKDEKGEHKYAVHPPFVDDLDLCRGNSSQFKFLIATVPDPIGSHLNIEFDRAMESLVRAAAVRGYTFERYWFPWRLEESSAIAAGGSSTAAHVEERLRQERPGLLIFRKLPEAEPQDAAQQPPDVAAKQDQLLLIFLVGETPTAGLNRPAFFKSLHYIAQLSDTPNPEFLLASPIFSGTLPSLGDAIAEYSGEFPDGKKPAFHVVNYSARSDALVAAFRDRLLKLNKSSPFASDKNSSFASLDLKISDAQDELVRYLCELGYGNTEIAVLSEDGTAYGNATADYKAPESPNAIAGNKAATTSNKTSNASTEDAGCPTSAVLHLTFPRDLSSIRNATENEGASSEPQQIAGVNIPSIGVALTLRQDQSNEHDAPPDFARAQSSARIDRALRTLVRTLRTRRIQAVLVTATNPLDRVFLLDYFRVTVPDVRLATVGADDFMLARPQHIDLSGTLAVTSLPLTETSVWVVEKDESKQIYLNFPSNASEGLFLAAANLLGPKPQLSSEAVARGCADISIVGKTGFRPAVREGRQRIYPCFAQLLDKNAAPPLDQQVKPTVIVGPQPPRTTAHAGSAKPTASGSVSFTWVIALIVLMVASALHIAVVCSSNEWLGMRRLPKVPRFAVALSKVRQVQLLFLLIATEQVFLVEWIATTTTVALNAMLLPYQTVLLVAHRALLVGSAALCGWLVFQFLANTAGKRSGAVMTSVAVSFGFVTLTALCWWMILNGGLGDHDLAKLVATRTTYFLEGLSPLLPIFFVLLAYYLWALNNLLRLSLVVSRVSLNIPRDNESSTALGEMVARLQTSIRPNIELKASTLASLGLGIVGCCLVRLLPALRGFDHWAFRVWLVTGGFVLLLLIVVATFHRTWNVWLQLRRILHALDVASLGRAFSHVPKELSSVRIWSFGDARTALMVQVRTAELLQRMAIKYPVARAQAAAAGAESSPQTFTEVNGLSAGAAEESAFPVLREVMGIVDSGGIVGRPLAKKLSALLNRRLPETGFLFDPEAAAASTMPIGEKNLLELYVAYRFVAFFRYVMRQIRIKLTFAIYGFACLVVAASVYPFQGRESLGTLMSFVFVLLLGGVAAMVLQMYHDPILKRLEEPSSNLSQSFEIATKLIGVAGVPLFAVLASQYPSVAEVMLNWLRPFLETPH